MHVLHCAVYLYLFALTYNGTWNNLKPVSYCNLDLQLYNNKVGEIVVNVTDRQGYRVDRVLSFLSSRRNWDSPTPLSRRRVCPPLWLRGGGAHSLGGEEVGESQFQRGDIHCVTQGIYTRVYFVGKVFFCI